MHRPSPALASVSNAVPSLLAGLSTRFARRATLLLAACALLAPAQTALAQDKEKEKPKPEANVLEFEEVPFAEAFDNTVTGAERWDDGKTEVAVYSARRAFAGKPRNFDEIRLTSAENVRTDLWVKAEQPLAGKPLTRAMRHAVLATVQTDFNTATLGSTLFFDRANPAQLHKATFTSQDWAGAVLKELQFYTTPARFQANSHWDYQGNIDIDLDLPPQTLLENQLPLTLRTCKIKAERKIVVNLIPDQFGDTAIKPAPVAAVIARVKPDKAMTVGGRGMEPKDLIKYVVRYSNGPSAEYFFDAKAPHLLLAYAHSDGRSGMLKKADRTALSTSLAPQQTATQGQ